MATTILTKEQLNALLDLAEQGVVMPVVDCHGEEIKLFVIEE